MFHAYLKEVLIWLLIFSHFENDSGSIFVPVVSSSKKLNTRIKHNPNCIWWLNGCVTTTRNWSHFLFLVSSRKSSEYRKLFSFLVHISRHHVHYLITSVQNTVMNHNLDSPLAYILTQLLLSPILLSCIVIRAEQGNRSLNSEHPVLDTRRETNAEPLFPKIKFYWS